MDTVYLIVFLAASAYLLIRISGAVGQLSGFNKYSSYSRPHTDGGLGFNVVYRVLTPLFYVVGLFVFLKVAGLSIYVRYLWLVVLIYYVFHLVNILIKGKLFITNLTALIVSSALGFVSVYYLNTVFLNKASLQDVLPESADIRSELWLVFILYMYSIFNQKSISYSLWSGVASRRLERRYLSLVARYNDHLDPTFQSEKELNDLLFAIMLYEDLNRPSWMRAIERVLFRMGLAKSIGIMQVKADSLVSDIESIRLAEKKILESYLICVRNGVYRYSIISHILGDYNRDAYYREEVLGLYGSVQGFSSSLRELEWSDPMGHLESSIDMHNVLRTLVERTTQTMTEEEKREFLESLGSSQASSS